MHDASKVVNPEGVDAWQLQGVAPRRIAVIGRGGAGKTTIALRLGQELGLPVIHLDRLYWSPGWHRRNRETLAQIERLRPVLRVASGRTAINQ